MPAAIWIESSTTDIALIISYPRRQGECQGLKAPLPWGLIDQTSHSLTKNSLDTENGDDQSEEPDNDDLTRESINREDTSRQTLKIDKVAKHIQRNIDSLGETHIGSMAKVHRKFSLLHFL
jgi:hypothetical protein